MKGLLKPQRKVRVDPTKGGTEVHDDGHSWAVSYADFLMVLLSFFVIFFSVDQNKKETIIDQISNNTELKDAGGKSGKQLERTIASHSTLPAGIDKVATEVEGFFVEKMDKNQKLFIYFDDNIYPPGKIDLPAKQVEKLKEILTTLQPFNDEINITFVGHTDESVVSKSKNFYLANNFDLSSLRATRALQQAVKAKFDPRHMYAQGVAEHTRGTRTLSLVISPGGYQVRTLRLLFIVLSILFSYQNVQAEGSAQGINVVVELENKMTAKIKNLIAPVDPDAIVLTKIDLKNSKTELVGVPVAAVGMFSTQESTTVEEVDIEKINVTVYTSLESFPNSVSKIVEEAVLATSKKAKVAISAMDPTMKAAIVNRKMSENSQAESMKKIASLSESVVGTIQTALKRMLLWLSFGLLVFVGSLGAMQYLLNVPNRKAYGQMLNQLGDKIAQGSGAGAAAQVMASPNPTKGTGSESSSGASNADEIISSTPKDFSIEEEFFKQMSNESLAMLLAECYWCEKDTYAAWIWSKLLPQRRIELLTKWPMLNPYSSYISRLTPKWERYHTDGAYLNPIPNLMISNSDLKEMLRKQPKTWGVLSLMRKQSVSVSLQERVELTKFKDPTFKPEWPTKESVSRNLPMQIEISSLTIEDEENLLTNPDILADDMKKQLPSLVWLALLEKSDREKILAKIPAQGLAEAWTAPQSVFEKILDCLPEKKRELVSEYAKQITPNRNSEWLREISAEAVKVLIDKKKSSEATTPKAA
ncbi:MAG: flagellar motor protein MotB [Bdellovibrionia bacterium]